MISSDNANSPAENTPLIGSNTSNGFSNQEVQIITPSSAENEGGYPQLLPIFRAFFKRLALPEGAMVILEEDGSFSIQNNLEQSDFRVNFVPELVSFAKEEPSDSEFLEALERKMRCEILFSFQLINLLSAQSPSTFVSIPMDFNQQGERLYLPINRLRQSPFHTLIALLFASDGDLFSSTMNLFSPNNHALLAAYKPSLKRLTELSALPPAVSEIANLLHQASETVYSDKEHTLFTRRVKYILSRIAYSLLPTLATALYLAYLANSSNNAIFANLGYGSTPLSCNSLDVCYSKSLLSIANWCINYPNNALSKSCIQNEFEAPLAWILTASALFHLPLHLLSNVIFEKKCCTRSNLPLPYSKNRSRLKALTATLLIIAPYLIDTIMLATLYTGSYSLTSTPSIQGQLDQLAATCQVENRTEFIYGGASNTNTDSSENFLIRCNLFKEKLLWYGDIGLLPLASTLFIMAGITMLNSAPLVLDWFESVSRFKLSHISNRLKEVIFGRNQERDKMAADNLAQEYKRTDSESGIWNTFSAFFKHRNNSTEFEPRSNEYNAL